ncbi:hypothetical protein L1987_74834 [Smallanthus sonchifolius]|uniref:Uncharacterized protein n=1 Tax=Smallanthus sonchifolius TaxID=185202 RepID=A0ACB9A323_9ASTR|nr:hypothetical protein L1987_74834 [Smallanthus sonchifolius]
MDLQMTENRKRGASTCKKKLSSSNQSGVKFNANDIAIGEKAADFMSWVGAELKNRIPINKVAKDVDSKPYDRIWEYIKLTTLPFKVYKNIDRQIWDSFVANASKEEFQTKSQKARMSAAKNIDPTHIGRWGYYGLETVFESRWNQLVKSYPELDVVQDDGSKMYFVSRARLNPVTNLYGLGPNPQSKGEFIGTLEDLFGATSDKQTMPNEIDAYRQYSYALRAMRVFMNWWLLGMGRKPTGGDESLMELKFGGDRSLMEVRSYCMILLKRNRNFNDAGGTESTAGMGCLAKPGVLLGRGMGRICVGADPEDVVEPRVNREDTVESAE